MLILENRQSPLPWLENHASSINPSVFRGHRRRIEEEAGRFEYGASDEEINQRYTFVTIQDVNSYYENMRDSNPRLVAGIDNANAFSNHTVNLQDGGGEINKASLSSNIFRSRATNLVDVLTQQKTAYFRLIVGPIGSGKTAFSKGLFCAGLRNFWDSKVIPSRIEWRHSKQSADLNEYIARCASRDFTMYLIAEVGDEEFDAFLSNCNLQTAKEIRLVRKAFLSDPVFQDERWLRLLSDRVNLLDFLGKAVRCSEINKLAVIQAGVKFCFSFDGFDVINSVEAFTPRKMSQPVKKLKDFFVNGLIDSKYSEMFFQNGNAHFLVYVRDTTLKVLENELKHFRLSRINVENRWICPPSYTSMCAIMTRRLLGNDQKLNKGGSTFVKSIVRRVKSDVDDAFSTKISRPISGVFGWNVRNMKRHIGRQVLLMLNNSCRDNLLFREKLENAGVGSYVFSDLVRIHGKTRVHKYEVERSLVFQDHSGEVGVRFNVDEDDLYDLCFDERYDEEILERISRFSDDGTIGDCVYNAFFDDEYAVSEETFSLAPLLILSKLKNSAKGSSQGVLIERFVVACGCFNTKGETRQLIEFLLGWMVSVGLIATTVHTKGASPLRSNYYITKTGKYLLNKGAFSISYLDSACFCAFWPTSWVDEIKFYHARKSVEESTIAAVHNACELAIHLKEVEANILTHVKLEHGVLYSRNKDCFGFVELACPEIVHEAEHILYSVHPNMAKRKIFAMAQSSLARLENLL